jgi:MscS family membrane protein
LVALFLLLLPALFPAQFVCAQDTGAAEQPVQDAPSDVEQDPQDAFDRLTPRSSVRALLRALEEHDFERAAEYLDLSFRFGRAAQHSGVELADMLDIVLQRKLWIDTEGLSDRPEGLTGDGLVVGRDEIGRIKVDGEDVTLFVDRVQSADGELVWKVSRGTVAEIPPLYDRYAYAPWIESLADALPDIAFLGIEFFKWVISLATLLLSFLVLFVLGWLAARMLVSRDSPIYPRVRRFFRGPIATLGALIISGAVLLDLGVGVTGQRWLRAHTLLTFAAVWLLFSLMGLAVEIVRGRFIARDRESAIVLLRPASNAMKILIFLAAMLFWLDNVGFNISTLLAGLGVGGLAVALALQRPLEDIFGALSIFSAQVVRVGDFCNFGDKFGTVEEIGLRVTRIRTLDDTVLCVPNARLANEYVLNFSARRRIRYLQTVQLRVDTTREQLEQILDGARTALAEHEMVIDDSVRVRFKTLDLEGFTIEAVAYVRTTVWAEFLEVAEAVNLRVVQCVTDAGAHFAVPIDASRP